MIDQSSKNIVIVSSDKEFIDQMCGILSNSQYICSVIADDALFLDAVKTGVPDLFIIDVGKGQEKNIELLNQIRGQADEKVASIPIIAASQSGDLVDISSILKLGIQDYIVKSKIDAPHILTKIARQLHGLPLIGSVQTPTPSAEIPTSSSVTRDASSVKLLIVEDDKFLRDLAVQKITKEGFQVFAAMDGEQGLVLAEKELPDIILLDILLPGMDGFEVLKQIRANPGLKDAKVAMLSNFGQREDVEKALKAGAQQFMVKANFTLDEILDEVKNMVATLK